MLLDLQWIPIERGVWKLAHRNLGLNIYDTLCGNLEAWYSTDPRFRQLQSTLLDIGGKFKTTKRTKRRSMFD